MSDETPRSEGPLDDTEYRVLAAAHGDLRRFLREGEERARAAGLTAAQRQLLIVLRAHEGPDGPAIGELAGALGLRHHSAVELVQRAEAAGLVARRNDRSDRRTVRLSLTAAGEHALEALTSLHRKELRRLASANPDTPGPATVGTTPAAPSGTAPGAGRGERGATEAQRGEVRVRSVRLPGDASGARRVFVDRSWPDGLEVEDAPFDEWLGRIAPTESLRRRFEDGPARRSEAAELYRVELGSRHGADLDRLAAEARTGGLTLLTAAEDLQSSPAAVLAGVIRERTG